MAVSVPMEICHRRISTPSLSMARESDGSSPGAFFFSSVADLSAAGGEIASRGSGVATRSYLSRR